MILRCRRCKGLVEAFNPGKDDIMLGCASCLGELEALQGLLEKMEKVVEAYGKRNTTMAASEVELPSA